MFYSKGKDAEGQIMSQDENEEEGEPLIIEDNIDDLENEDEKQRINKLNNHGSNRSQKQTSSTIFGKPLP
jgi:hypothetical protein